MPKLVILRGNSGSGKSSTARLVRDSVHDYKNHKVALVEQDYLRRTILKEKEAAGTHNVALIEHTTQHILDQGYDVILEGIFVTKRYRDMLTSLLQQNTDNYVYYFDISLEETLRRHSTKPNSHEFGETEMRSWYVEKDYLGIQNEVIISEDMTQETIVNKIIKDVWRRP